VGRALLLLPGRFPRRDLILDSNLLLLFLIGSYDREPISSFKRVRAYSSDDCEILRRLVAGFRNLISTPHVLTEVSNLGNSLPSPLKAFWFDDFAIRLCGIKERNVSAIELAALPEFANFGLTDAALARLAETTLLVTADDRLCSHLKRRNLLASSFNDIRIEHSRKN
jgi:hypothetical protein